MSEPERRAGFQDVDGVFRAHPRRSFTAAVRGVTAKVVPHQLKDELRAHLDAAGKKDMPADIWTSAGANGTTVVMADCDQGDLEAALSAHTPDPLYGQPEAKALAALAAKPDWTQEDRDAALRAVLARLTP
jgi:hypothetical protein